VPFDLDLSFEAESLLATLAGETGDAVRLRKIEHALARLQSNPRHPGLNTHRYRTKAGPNGEAVWEAYVENRAPGAWRIWFCYGPGRNVISVLAIGPHPD